MHTHAMPLSACISVFVPEGRAFDYVIHSIHDKNDQLAVERERAESRHALGGQNLRNLELKSCTQINVDSQLKHKN